MNKQQYVGKIVQKRRSEKIENAHAHAHTLQSSVSGYGDGTRLISNACIWVNIFKTAFFCLPVYIYINEKVYFYVAFRKVSFINSYSALILVAVLFFH